MQILRCVQGDQKSQFFPLYQSDEQYSVSSFKFSLIQTVKASYNFSSPTLDSLYGNHAILVCHVVGHADAFQAEEIILNTDCNKK